MKRKFLSPKVVTVLLVLHLGTNPALAQTQGAINSQKSGSIFSTNTAAQINDFLGDVYGFVQNDLVHPLSELFHSALGAIQIPDLGQLLTQIMNGSANGEQGAVLSETLENKNDSQSSYSIREDLSKYATRTVALGVADQTALSQEAQSQIAQTKQATEQDTQEIINLGEESQNLDVTQQILQNLSQQTALNSRINERILLEAQQSRIDRALGNTLITQTAAELSAINTADRRKSIAVGNAASQLAGLLMMPGGITLNSENK